MFKTANKSEKVSDKIIAQIRDAILSGQLKPGDKLASEKELMGQFEVSKATMREALRALEVIGLIEVRKGTAGGAFVAEVDMKTTIRGIINFLHFQTVSISEITMLRYLIEPTVAQIAAVRRTSKDIDRLGKIIGEKTTSGVSEISKEISFHRYLARMTQNTILTLVIDMIDNLLKSMKAELGLPGSFYEYVRDAHSIILECLIQQDGLAAKTAMMNDVIGVGKYLCEFTKTAPFDPLDLYYEEGAVNAFFEVIPGACVVPEGHSMLQERGVTAKRVGSGSLYMVMGNGDGVPPATAVRGHRKDNLDDSEALSKKP